MKSKSALRWLLLALLGLLPACASAAPAAGPAGASYKVFVASASQGAGGISVLATGEKGVLQLPVGTLSPDGSRLYVTALDSRGKPVLRSLDTQTGTAADEKAISSDSFEPSGIISANGRWLVRRHVDAGLKTHLGIFNTATLAERDVSLDGVFALDAIDNAGNLLYLLETIGTSSYRVRDYDLVRDRLDADVIVDKTDASPVMNGTRVATAASASGNKVFGLYQRPGKPPFIHVLWTDQKLAWCVDLPPAGAADAASGWSLLLDEAGAHLYAISARGIIADVQVSDLPHLVRTESFRPPAASLRLPGWPPPLVRDASAKGYEGLWLSGLSALSMDRKTIYVPDASGYVTIATGSLHPTGRGLSGTSVSSLAISPDGKVLFAVQPASNLLVAVDAANGRELGRYTMAYPLVILMVT